MTARSHCEQPNTSKPPIVTPGEISPEALRSWEMGCKQLFSIKSIEGDNQVAYVAWNLQDPHIQDWYSNDSVRLKGMSFNGFLKEQCMLSSTQGARSFNEWSIEVKSQNMMLCGMDSHLDDNALWFHLKVHMMSSLLRKYHLSAYGKEKVLRTWLNNVCMMDEELQATCND
ncbi:hypothetical protein BS17DRAFT_766025 [Gyrodon lividus]|nr:hypothetical protein BS17DRAFT_766025 [Gyrodon lividus]